MESILQKSDTHRQLDLVRTILNYSDIYGYYDRVSDKTNAATSSFELRNQPKLNQSITLSDGRKLAFAEHGDPKGHPIVICHRNYGGRLQCHPDFTIAEKLGARIIIPDRPGVGDSSFHKKHSFLHWVNDLKQLMQHLGIDKFSIIGNSTGSCYACAYAYKHPENIQKIYLLNSPAPFLNFSELSSMAPTEKFMVTLAKYTPNLLRLLAKNTLKKLCENSEQYLQKTLQSSCRSDAEILSDPQIRKNLLQSSAASVKLGTEGLIREFILLTSSWGFDPSKIQPKVHCWYGKGSNLIPEPMAKRFVASLKNPEVRVFENDGHFLLYKYWYELIEEISNAENC